MRSIAALAVLLIPMAAVAQVIPKPDQSNPRLQTASWQAGEPVLLTIMPSSGVTVFLEPGEEIQRATIDASDGFDIRVSPERNSFIALADQAGAMGKLNVSTGTKDYTFELRTGYGLTAASVVRFQDPAVGGHDPLPVAEAAPDLSAGSWKLRGKQAVRPLSISDDGARTWIEFGADQPLPAIFTIGASGEEEVVNGHMRQDRYVIDRVYLELVFRIDKLKATAKREQVD